MTHRDDREAERARLFALEDEVAALRARAEAAEKEAASARAEAEEKRGRAEKERRSAAGTTRAARVRTPAPPPGAWPLRSRRIFVVVAAALNALAAIATFGAFFWLGFDRAMMVGGVALVGVAIARGVTAHLLRAPGVFGAVIITLLDLPLVLFGIALTGSGALLSDVLSGLALEVVSGVLAVGVWVVGSIGGAHWAADAASTETTSD